jgi:hypothetical protein
VHLFLKFLRTDSDFLQGEAPVLADIVTATLAVCRGLLPSLKASGIFLAIKDAIKDKSNF